MNPIINSGRPKGIGRDQLELDVMQMLKAGIPAEDIRSWCDQISTVAEELDKLHKLVSDILPRNTDGHCAGLQVSKNGWLSMAFCIQSSQMNFKDSTLKVAKNTWRLLNKLEKENDNA